MSNVKTPAHAGSVGAAGHPRRPRGEAVQLGKEMYERDIRRQVEDDHHGEIISIDGRAAIGLSATA